MYRAAEEKNGRDTHLEIVAVSSLTLRTSDLIYRIFSEKKNVVSHIGYCQSTSLGRLSVGHVTRLPEKHREILISVSSFDFGAVHRQGAR